MKLKFFIPMVLSGFTLELHPSFSAQFCMVSEIRFFYDFFKKLSFKKINQPEVLFPLMEFYQSTLWGCKTDLQI